MTYCIYCHVDLLLKLIEYTKKKKIQRKLFKFLNILKI